MRAGTEKIEEYLREVFPQARILRMDADTTRRKGSYEKILSAFSSEEADILLGTQMIVKGHDFPSVTLVGILMADLSLYGDDYRSAERTFQLLTQAAGRAGRGTEAGDVVIQTYQPEHYAIRYSAKQDYEGFYAEETAYRRLLRYPPAAHMMAVQIQSEEEEAALAAANLLRMRLMEMQDAGADPAERMDPVQVIGPAAGSMKKLRDLFRFVLYIKAEKYDTLIGCKDMIEKTEARERRDSASRFRHVEIQFDFDPINPF
jgi:primosomal protein N' (replication factor Y)